MKERQTKLSEFSKDERQTTINEFEERKDM